MPSLVDRPRTVVLVGGYGGGTLGDEITLDATLWQLAELKPSPQVIVVTPDCALTCWQHPDITNAVETRGHFGRLSTPAKLQLLIRAGGRVSRYRRLIARRVNQSLTRYLEGVFFSSDASKTIGRSPVLYLVGGGYIHGMEDGSGLAETCIRVWLANNAPVYVGPIGIMPISNAGGRLAELFARVRHLSLRDESSFNWARGQSQLHGTPLSHDPDDAVSAIATALRAGAIGPASVEGRNSLEFAFSWCQLFSPDVDEGMVEQQLIDFLNFATGELGLHGVGIPMHLEWQIDFRRMNALRSRCKYPERLRIIPPPYRWTEVASLVRGMRFTLSTRYHLAWLSLCLGTPALALYAGEYYRCKNQAICQWFGRPDWAYDLGSKPSQSIEWMRAVLDNPHLQSELQERFRQLADNPCQSMRSLRSGWSAS